MSFTPNQPSFTQQDVEILDRRTVYQGYFRIEKVEVKHRLFAGGWTKPFQREVFERGHASAALLYDPVLHKIVLIEQFRIGPLGQTDYPWLIELVAGIIEPGESAKEVAIRETEEEAGLIPKDLIHIIDCWISPGGSTEKLALYCARVDASCAGGIHGLPEENEDIRVLVLNVQEVYDLLDQGKIHNATALIALLWFRLNEQHVRNQWLNV